MREVARDVWLLDGLPLDAFNVYLAEGILIDAGTRWSRYRLMRQLSDRTVSLIALTHCHPDHQGIAAYVCKKYRVPLACHEADAAAMEGREPMWPRNWILRLGHRLWSGPPHPVARVLRDGDRVGSFRVVHTPGHTPGHVAYFRESDGVAIVGDVITNVNFRMARNELVLPPALFSVDVEENCRSLRRLVDLRPSVVCFGHGPPLRDLSLLKEYLRKVELRFRARRGGAP
jgi:glyoxylase-like metal-dependent hydrolase (beta-lactamase superfamily II)